jgi:hypothetical protein
MEAIMIKDMKDSIGISISLLIALALVLLLLSSSQTFGQFSTSTETTSLLHPSTRDHYKVRAYHNMIAIEADYDPGNPHVIDLGLLIGSKVIGNKKVLSFRNLTKGLDIVLHLTTARGKTYVTGFKLDPGQGKVLLLVSEVAY